MISLTILSSTLAITAAITGVALVFLALWIAGLISPRSYNAQKGEPYECGIPTRGESMAQFKVGYYLFAILFLMFDVECVFLFPWAVKVKELGAAGLVSIAFFFSILVLGLVYAWRKGALEWK
ncbi:MAG: NADH-quinone oxidoreductase subunit A [Bacteroides sp.]|nr:NADH-quinone oxidoreductase subunit A [Bacteroides sp.]MDE6038993.1 NADH-quinone oxidoreductase subunit A [Paramuribaculum sp.]MBD5296920.1 NADH-quinone oxidoreductase subunit A [Bacteroides sp.]MBD5319405.1 NADH-quinone oxidoreductase subunit A [Bacteroides sp.]MBD5351016.1 NADH-quinone oxidoreductase subunit A [Bacteroides sp.]